MTAFLLPSTASAQDASYYTCDGQSNPVTIPALPLDQALEIYTQITRCPVSIDIPRSTAAKRRATTTHSVRGQMTPDVALRQMLAGTRLKSRPIKGGYSVY